MILSGPLAGTAITLHGIESEPLLILLDKEGVCASSGSACLADSDEPSHVIKAMKPEGNQSHSMIRFSLGLETTGAEVANVCGYARRLAETLRAALG